MNNNKETHPAYGLVGFTRLFSSGKNPLFGSSIEHSSSVRLTIKRASVSRDLNSDHFFDEGTLIEVEMSQAQFAEAITSMNVGDGTPCTIRFVAGEGRIPDIENKNTREEFSSEFTSHVENNCLSAKKLFSEMQELFETKKSIGKGDKEELLKKFSHLIMEMDNNSKFISDQFDRQMDKTVNEAKAEVEAFVQNKLNSIALQTLAQNNKNLLEEK